MKFYLKKLKDDETKGPGWYHEAELLNLAEPENHCKPPRSTSNKLY